MQPDIILQLIYDIYSQNLKIQQELQRLRTEIENKTEEHKPTKK